MTYGEFVLPRLLFFWQDKSTWPSLVNDFRLTEAFSSPLWKNLLVMVILVKMSVHVSSLLALHPFLGVFSISQWLLFWVSCHP